MMAELNAETEIKNSNPYPMKELIALLLSNGVPTRKINQHLAEHHMSVVENKANGETWYTLRHIPRNGFQGPQFPALYPLSNPTREQIKQAVS
jgi:hypothetical protein